MIRNSFAILVSILASVSASAAVPNIPVVFGQLVTFDKVRLEQRQVQPSDANEIVIDLIGETTLSCQVPTSFVTEVNRPSAGTNTFRVIATYSGPCLTTGVAVPYVITLHSYYNHAPAHVVVNGTTAEFSQ